VTWHADLVVWGGRIYTAGTPRFAEALAVRGERIVAVGSRAEVAPLVGPATRVVDLRGRLALPGFHDAHSHFLGGALTRDQLDLLEVTCDDDLARLVAARIAERGPEEWVLGRGWDADRFPGGAWPSRDALDRVSPSTPVLLRRRDGHAALANTCALTLAGLSADTPDPPGGRLLRDAAGQLSGILLEDPALDLVADRVPRPPLAAQKEAVARLVPEALALGITSIQDDPSFDDRLQPGELYAQLYAEGRLGLRVTIWRRLGRPLAELREEEAALRSSGASAHHVRYGQLKGYLDGSLGSRTALLFDAYSDDPEAGAGVPVTEPETIEARLAEAHAAGYQVGLHAIGDRAVALALDAFQSLAPGDDPALLDALRAARHRIEHAQMFRPEDVPRAARLGAVASAQPIHLASDMRVAPARLGALRCETAYPWRAVLDAGARLAAGTDFPVEPLAPMPGVAAAVTRRSPRPADADLPAFHPEQGVSLDEVLRAYTHGSAWAAHQDHELGELAPGRLADLAVVSPDPFGLTDPDAAQLAAVRCELTIVGGRVVFEA
jgi:predicted amidohydrolase YtcJ